LSLANFEQVAVRVLYERDRDLEPLEDWGSETYSAPVAIARRCTPATSSADPSAPNPRRGWRCFRCSSRRLLWRCALTP